MLPNNGILLLWWTQASANTPSAVIHRHLALFCCFHKPTLVLSPDLNSEVPSLSTQMPPASTNESLTLGCSGWWNWLYVWISFCLPCSDWLLFFSLRLWSSPSVPADHSPIRRHPSVKKSFLSHSSLSRILIPSRFLSSLFFLLSYTIMWRFFYLAHLEVWGLLPGFGRCSVRIVLHIGFFFN